MPNNALVPAGLIFITLQVLCELFGTCTSQPLAQRLAARERWRRVNGNRGAWQGLQLIKIGPGINGFHASSYLVASRKTNTNTSAEQGLARN